MQINTLTPIHIYSGDSDGKFVYRRISDAQLEKYDLKEILKMMPDDKLLDSYFLKQLSSEQSSRKTFNTVFEKNISLDSIKPLYTLYCEDCLEKTNSEVALQIKSLTRPYIPGSTIKGSILTAIAYHFFNSNSLIFIKKLKDWIKIKEYNKKDRIDLIELYCMVWQKNSLDRKEKDSLDKSMKMFQSCILCEDLFFDELCLINASRIGGKKKNGEKSETPLGLKECIKENQSINNQMFTIDLDKKKRLKDSIKTENLICEQTLLEFVEKYLNKDMILQCINQFTRDMIKEEYNENILKLYDEIELKESIDIIKEIDKKSYLLRVGNSTNYWFKSISLIVKKKDYHFYSENYTSLFSPEKLNRKNPEGKSKPNTMPKTRVVYQDDIYFTPGYLEIVDD